MSVNDRRPARQAPGIRFFSMHFQAHEVQYFFDTRRGNPWWVAQHICEILGLSKNNVALVMRRLDPDEKRLITIKTLGGPQKMWCVNEAGLYSLILASPKPQAKAFKRWVTHEVLPEIRRTGGYHGNPLTPERFRENMQLAVANREHRGVCSITAQDVCSHSLRIPWIVCSHSRSMNSQSVRTTHKQPSLLTILENDRTPSLTRRCRAALPSEHASLGSREPL